MMKMDKNLAEVMVNIDLQSECRNNRNPLTWIGLFILLCFGVPSFAGGAVEPLEPAASAEDRLQSEEMIKAGDLTFSQNCTYCHGYKGVGGKARKMQCRTYTPDYLFSTISNGKQRGSLIMPPWKDSFNEETRWQLVAYILSLETLPSCSE